jgi:hypothetical protein
MHPLIKVYILKTHAEHLLTRRLSDKTKKILLKSIDRYEDWIRELILSLYVRRTDPPTVHLARDRADSASRARAPARFC